MPKGRIGTAKTDAQVQLNESIEFHLTQLKQKQRQLRAQIHRDHMTRCVAIGALVQSCGLFPGSLGEMKHEDFATHLAAFQEVLKRGIQGTVETLVSEI